MESTGKFDDIRSFNDDEMRQAVEELVTDEYFKKSVTAISGGVPFDAIAAVMRSCTTVHEFQQRVCYPIVTNLIKQCSDEVSLDLSSMKDKSQAHVYMSNHRDIVLDSALLSIKLLEQGLDTVEIAIGDNLLIYPWIKTFVRLNKAFIVKRGLTMRQQLEASCELSSYIHHTITQKKQSIWIAQREGRAKDSSDETQESVIKMLALNGDRDVRKSLSELDIIPLTISYEFDPCDYLKAQEMQLKHDNPSYKKEAKDDLQNMSIGISGYKGRINYKTGKSLNEILDELPSGMSKPELYKKITERITNEIHQNYTLFPCNYVACDLLEGGDRFKSHYTNDDKVNFTDYLHNQIEKVDLPNKDNKFLMRCILNMYMKPVMNKMNSL